MSLLDGVLYVCAVDKPLIPGSCAIKSPREHRGGKEKYMFNFNTSKKQSEPNLNTLVNGGANADDYKAEGSSIGNQREAYINSKMQEIEKQRIEFMKKNPGFDMKAEMENPAFVEYVWGKGLTVEEAYFLAHKDEIIGAAMKKNRSAVSNRIAENGAGKNSPASVKKNPKDMTDKEIDAIIERVSRGEKISF